MPFHRFQGFYFGPFMGLEKDMSEEEKNAELNAAIQTRLHQLNDIIGKHEAALKAMFIPEAVWFEYAQWSDQHNGGMEGWLIGIEKWQGSWRLCHARDYYTDGEMVDIKPLVDATIFDRRRALNKIDGLREKIIQHKTKLVPMLDQDIENALKSLEKYPKAAK